MPLWTLRGPGSQAGPALKATACQRAAGRALQGPAQVSRGLDSTGPPSSPEAVRSWPDLAAAYFIILHG